MSYRLLFGKEITEHQNRIYKASKGEIPKSMHGTLFFNTVMLNQLEGEIFSHWFDGNGAILKLKLNPENNTIESTHKIVQTEGYRKEREKGKMIYAQMYRTQSLVDRLKYGFGMSNRANTNVLPIKSHNRLYALWEGGNTYLLNKETLETIREDDLNGHIKKYTSFSAHCKRDPSGYIYNFGYCFRNPGMVLYKLDPKGIVHKSAIVAPKDTFLHIHDCFITEKHIGIYKTPLKYDSLIKYILGITSLKESKIYDKGPNELQRNLQSSISGSLRRWKNVHVSFRKCI